MFFDRRRAVSLSKRDGFMAPAVPDFGDIKCILYRNRQGADSRLCEKRHTFSVPCPKESYILYPVRRRGMGPSSIPSLRLHPPACTKAARRPRPSAAFALHSGIGHAGVCLFGRWKTAFIKKDARVCISDTRFFCGQIRDIKNESETGGGKIGFLRQRAGHECKYTEG